MPPDEIKRLKQNLKTIMWEKVGIIRNGKDLWSAIFELKKINSKIKRIPDNKDELELKNMVTTSILIAQSALNRKESRGAHNRSDFPLQDDHPLEKASGIQKAEAIFSGVSP